MSKFIRKSKSCERCPLRDRNRVWGERPEGEVRIATVGEAPGAVEDSTGIPFSGPSGRIFNKTLVELGIQRSGIWVTNVLCCKPPDTPEKKNDIDCAESRGALEACRAGFDEELRAMKAAGVKVIVAQGSTATRALGIVGSHSDVRGSVYTHFTGIRVIPTWHPAAVLRSGKRDEQGFDKLAAYMADWKKAKEIAENGWVPPKENFVLEPSIAQLEAYAVKMSKAHTQIAVDIETTGLNARRGAQLVVVGLADSPYSGFSVPFLTRHGMPYWHNGEERRAKTALQAIFDSCPLLFQYCFFDVIFLRYLGFRIPDESIEDTIAVHGLVSPETEHNLQFIVSMYGLTAAWKAWFRDRDKSILEIDQLEMRRYNLRDCVVLHQVMPPMKEHLEKLGLTNFYREETQRLVAPLLEMTDAGTGFDRSRMNAFAKVVEKTTASLESELREMFDLPASFNFSSDDELRWLLYGEEPGKFRDLWSWVVEYEKQLKAGKKLDEKVFRGAEPKPEELPEGVISITKKPTLEVMRKGSKAYEEIVKIAEVQYLAAPRYRLRGWSGVHTDSKKLSVSAQGLLSFRIGLQNRLSVLENLVTPKQDEIDSIVLVLAFLEKLEALSEMQKLGSSFVKYGPDPDNRIRCTWSISGTSTGRLSSSRPNLEQLPAEGPGAEVRNFFVAAPGCKLISADFDNGEVAALGYVTGDPSIISIYESGQNIHDINTKSVLGIQPEDPLWKSARRGAKIFQFGGLSYGGTPRSIYKKVLMAAPGLRITFAEFEASVKAWMESHPAYVAWREKVTREVLEKRIVYHDLGRARIFLGRPGDTTREAMNFQIQGLLASIINRAMIRVYEKKQALCPRTRFVLQVHDELVLEAPDEEVEVAKGLLQSEMQRPVLVNGRETKFRVNVGVGSTFGET